MSQEDRDTVWHQGAPAQLGARTAQKKTNQSGLIGAAAPDDAVDAYEKLRAAVLGAEPTSCPGLGILHREGLAAWLRALGHQPRADDGCDHHPTLALWPTCDQPPETSELTRLIASIIVSIGTESAHA
jgi:hypothetical protein